MNKPSSYIYEISYRQLISMKIFLNFFFLLVITGTSCNPFPGPRNIDWKKEWKNNQTKLKALTQDILKQVNKKYTAGINEFPDNFDYPFDDGFSIRTPFVNNGNEKIDINNITITFYVDRGLLDHYSAFIFTNDSSSIDEFDRNVLNGGNDFKIESNWYMIND
jgi:hypothetical protein